ncbi:hypothetical protein ACFYNX_26035 [Streptomyces sp. NPDC007872]|uniref:hypothetical protein n=1 Tax=Streptomyces sp. NPDC007872 TaxID=3364782 RepID=UPI0036BE35AE
MTQLPVTRVNAGDIRAADRTAHFADLLFTVPDHGPAAHMPAQDRAAAAIALTWNPGPSDLDETRLLRVIHATGRTHRPGGEGVPSLHVGTVMLGGEIAARYLHQQLAHKHGPDGFEPLEAAIATLWPLPGETLPRVQGDVGMNLRRLVTGPYKVLFATAEIKAMEHLARAMPDSVDQATRLLCVARACRYIVHDRTRLLDDLPAVREMILAARTDSQSAGREPAVRQDVHSEGTPGATPSFTAST